MGFLAPYMLWGAAAAAIPIALHFFFRSRYRTVPWAAMTFLLTSIEQTSRRLKFQELLLLLARVALLVLLALALARPLSTTVAGNGKGEAVDAAFIFDTSFSMGAREGAESRLDRAKAAALGVIDQLPPHSTVQVIACADRAALLGPRAASNLDQARDLIQQLELTDLATDFFPGVVEAAAVLQRGQSPNRELYLFSDMQRLGWEQQAAPLNKALLDVSRKATVYLVHCSTHTPKNVAVVGIVPQVGLPRPGERVDFAVLVRNTGTQAANNLEVTLIIDGQTREKATQALPTLAAGETRATTLSAVVGKAGLRVVTATVKHDDLAPDNRFDQVILVREHVRVLVVDGGPNPDDPSKASTFPLMHALVPLEDEARIATWHIRPQLVTPRQAAPELLAAQDLCILVNAALPDAAGQGNRLSPEFLDQLNTFVRQGHGLIVFGGDNVRADAYNRILYDQYRLLPAKLTGTRELPAQKPLHFNRDTITLPWFAKLREDDLYKSLNQVNVWRTLDAQEPQAESGPKGGKEGAAQGESAAVVMRYEDGKPAAIVRKAGAGEVLLLTTSADLGYKKDSLDPTWTDWSDDPTYLPFIHTALGHLLHGQTQSHNAVAGQRLVWHAPDRDAGRPFELVLPGGRQVKLGLPEMVQGRPVLTLDKLDTAGVYRLVTATSAGGESANLENFNAPGPLDERLGFKPIHVVAGTDPGTFSGAERSNREWTWWLLAAVLAVTVGEALLAWFCGRAW